MRLTIFFIICIICIIIFCFIKRKHVHLFLDKVQEYSLVNKPHELTKTIKPPSIYNQNADNTTEYDFRRLFEKIQKKMKKQLHLEKGAHYNFYTQSTTNDRLRMNLDMITKYVVLLLNEDEYYNFSKTNYGDVEVWVDKEGNEEIKYELFLLDKRHYFEIKLEVNILKFLYGKRKGEEYAEKTSPYIFPHYNIGIPNLDQMIPLPEEVITTGNLVIGTSTISPNNPVPIKYLYLNGIEIKNSDLIVDYEKDKYPFHRMEVNEKGFSGTNDSTLEYVNILNKPMNAPYIENGLEYNKWITLDAEPKYASQWPAKSPPTYWNADGDYYYGKGDDKNGDPEKCNVFTQGIIWSKQKEELQPTLNPTLFGLPRNCGENNWLFELTGDSTPNTFFGGGKM